MREDGVPTPAELVELEEELRRQVMSIMEKSVGVDPGTYEVYVAQRHGFIPTGIAGHISRFKISFRLFVSGYKTTLYSIKNAIINNGCTSFDLSVYSRNRRICMILGSKNKGDTRLLIPSDRDVHRYAGDKEALRDPEFICNYLVQYVEEDTWPTQRVNLDEYLLMGRERDAQEHTDGRRPPKVRRTIVEPLSFETARPLLHLTGFSNPRQVHEARVEGTQIQVPFDCDARDDCPLCHKQHDHQNWLALIDTKSGVAVRNLSDRCYLTPLISPLFLHPNAVEVVNGFFSHSTIAKGFLKSRRRTLHYHHGTGTFHEFKDQKWSAMPDDLLLEAIRAFINDQVLGTQLEKVEHWADVAKKLDLKDDVQSYINRALKEMKNANNVAGTNGFVTGVSKMMRGMCFADSNLFDRHHDLLHFTNGVLDLETREFRESVPCDYNTITTGYEYDPSPSEEAIMQHQAFMDRIYPDPAHREVAQRVLGSTLSGYNKAKKIFIFTDNGGETGGNNGKTQVSLLHVQLDSSDKV